MQQLVQYNCKLNTVKKSTYSKECNDTIIEAMALISDLNIYDIFRKKYSYN